MSGNSTQNTLMLSPQLAWVKLAKYCALSGDTKDAVYARRKKGQWLDGLHYKVDPCGRLWINLKEIEQWIENGNVNLPDQLKSRPGSRRAIPKRVTACV